MMSRLLKNKLALLWMVFFTAMVFLGNFVLSDVMSADSETIQNMRDGVVEPGEGSYAATAFFFNLFPAPLDVVLILAVGWLSLGILMLRLKTPQANLLAYYLTIPALLTCMIRPQKETIVILLAILVTWIVTQTSLSRLKKVALVVMCYAFYAAFFRTYFFLIIAAFAGTYLMLESRKAAAALVIALLGLAVIMLVPVDILYKLQSPRDIVNYGRIDSGLAGHRTAFMNPYQIESVWDFFLNYLYVVIRMNIPMVFDLSVKAWFWFGSVACYGYVLVKGLKQSTDEMRILAALFFAHMLVLMLFEPDTGSYTRHITSVFVYLTPALMVVDEYFSKKKAPQGA